MIGHQMGNALFESVIKQGDSLMRALAECTPIRRNATHGATAPINFDDWMRARKEAAHSAFMAIRYAA